MRFETVIVKIRSTQICLGIFLKKCCQPKSVWVHFSRNAVNLNLFEYISQEMLSTQICLGIFLKKCYQPKSVWTYFSRNGVNLNRTEPWATVYE